MLDEDDDALRWRSRENYVPDKKDLISFFASLIVWALEYDQTEEQMRQNWEYWNAKARKRR
jgi:hypothetical protein